MNKQIAGAFAGYNATGAETSGEQDLISDSGSTTPGYECSVAALPIGAAVMMLLPLLMDRSAPQTWYGPDDVPPVPANKQWEIFKYKNRHDNLIETFENSTGEECAIG